MVTVSLKIDEALLERVDALTEKLSAAAHGASLSRSNALRVIIEAGLEALEPKTKKK